MHVNEVKFFDVIPIDSYGPGFFRVEGKILKSGIVCSGSGVSSWEGYCLLYTSPSPRDGLLSRMPSSA